MEHLTFEGQKKLIIIIKDKRVYDDQWEQLIKYWATEDAKVYFIYCYFIIIIFKHLLLIKLYTC